MASGSDVNLLLYPDLMSKDDLISVLKQRYIHTDSLVDKDKYELVELYNKYIIPLPQRKYRLNRRGREMTKKQILASKKRRLASTDNTAGQPEAKRKSTGKLLTSFEIPSAGGDRLKPPPSCIDTNKKTIKLSTSSKSDSTVSVTLEKHKINSNNHTVSSNLSDSVKKIKLHTTSSLQVSIDKADIKNDSHTEMETCDSTVKKELPKKIKKISWP